MTDFSNPILAKDTLVRRAIQSEGFEAGVQGWRIERDGSAEFQDLIARGEFEATRIDVIDGGVGVRIDPDEFDLGSNRSAIVFDTANAAQTNEGRLFADFDDEFASNTPRIGLIPPKGTNGGLQFFVNGEPEDLSIEARIVVLPVSIAGGRPSFQIGGSPFSQPVDLDVRGDVEIAGHIEASSMRPRESINAANQNITSTSYAVTPGGAHAGFSFTAPPSGTIRVDYYGILTLETSANVLRRILASFEIRNGGTVGSGSVFHSPSDNDALRCATTLNGQRMEIGATASRHVEGLTIGNTYNIRTMARIDNASNIATAIDLHRQLTVTPIM